MKWLHLCALCDTHRVLVYLGSEDVSSKGHRGETAVPQPAVAYVLKLALSLPVFEKWVFENSHDKSKNNVHQPQFVASGGGGSARVNHAAVVVETRKRR